MDNKEFANDLLMNYEKIYIDTCSLMDEAFLLFVRRYKDLFKEKGVKMIVPDMVVYELMKHMSSYSFRCRSEALDAKRVLERNKDIFEYTWLSDSEYQEIEHKNTHADPWILSELLVNSTKYNQVLITKDRGLQSDAFNLTLSKSISHRKLRVVAYNLSGELKPISRFKSLNRRDEYEVCKSLTIRHFIEYKMQILFEKYKAYRSMKFDV